MGGLRLSGEKGPNTIIAMTMTPKQFELLARVLRSKEPVTTGVRLVLLHGVPNAEAARSASVTAQSVHRSARRFMALHEDISQAYTRSVASTSGR